MLPLILEPRILTSLQQGLEFDSRLSAAGLQYMSDPIKVRSGCVKASVYTLHRLSCVCKKLFLNHSGILPGQDVSPNICRFDRYLLTAQCPVRCVHLPQSGSEGVTTV